MFQINCMLKLLLLKYQWCGLSCSAGHLVCCVFQLYGQADEEMMVRHGDPVGKIQRLFFILKLFTAVDVQSALAPLKRQSVCCSSSCSLKKWEIGVVLSDHPLSAGRVVLGRDGSPRYSHPSTATHQAVKGMGLHLLSGRNRNNYKICEEGV